MTLWIPGRAEAVAISDTTTNCPGPEVLAKMRRKGGRRSLLEL